MLPQLAVQSAAGGTPRELTSTMKPAFTARDWIAPQIVEVPSSHAPVHDIVLTGDDADLTTLPVHLQHGLDGARLGEGESHQRRDAEHGSGCAGDSEFAGVGADDGVDVILPYEMQIGTGAWAVAPGLTSSPLPSPSPRWSRGP